LESPIISRIGQVFIPVSDIHRSAEWYCRVLGAEGGRLGHEDRLFDVPVEDAVADAQEVDVPITTIAYGSQEGTVELGGETLEVPPDEPTLQMIAADTNGEFFRAVSGEQLRAVYEQVQSEINTVPVQQSVAHVAIGLGLAMALAAGLASLLWFNRLP
jgi:Ca-activated chloride channel homolog